jgi:hypothetical protein
MIEKRDLAGRTVIARASSRDPLGYVVRSGSNGPGGWGHWIVDRTGDPGTTQALPNFAQDDLVKLAVVGETVCPVLPHTCPACEHVHVCVCPLAHVGAEMLACLPRADG